MNKYKIKLACTIESNDMDGPAWKESSLMFEVDAPSECEAIEMIESSILWCAQNASALDGAARNWHTHRDE